MANRKFASDTTKRLTVRVHIRHVKRMSTFRRTSKWIPAFAGMTNGMVASFTRARTLTRPSGTLSRRERGIKSVMPYPRDCVATPFLRANVS